MSLYRLRTDFQFAIVTSFGGVAILGILPFAIYRFATGQLLAGSVDLAIVACIAVGVVLAWRGGNLERIGFVVVATSTVGCAVIANLLGLPGVLWLYPVLVANFLLISRGRALVASAAGVLLLLLQPRVFGTSLHMLMFLATTAMVSTLAYIFAHRTSAQRLQLESLAARDPLTGAHNRRAMEQDLALAIEAHRRGLGGFGLALLDLDHFKRINDTYGHEAGDAALVLFTTITQRAIRKLDRLYRIGGEEFVLLLPGADAAGLRVLCEHVRADVAAGLLCRDEPITVSIGATLLRKGDDSASWLARADTALYRAKHGGRNRVEVEGGSMTPRASGLEPGESTLRRR